MSTAFAPHDLYVAPNGNDAWSGSLPNPAPDGTDGPLATIQRARDIVRRRKHTGNLHGACTVWLRGGSYRVHQPVCFGPDDSAPVTYAAYPGETPVLDGGRVITGWTVGHHDGREAWVTTIPEVARGEWHFRELFVNGQRRLRAHYPKVNRPEPAWLWMDDVPDINYKAGLFDGANRFIAKTGDMQAWHNLTDVEVVALHYWIEERMPIASYNAQTREVQCSVWSTFSLKDDFNERWAKYYVDNVYEALTEPGEWYLDRVTGVLTYLPMDGETPHNTEVIAPCALLLLQLIGDPSANRYVEFLRFEGITFAHTDWRRTTSGEDPNQAHRQGVELASAAQSAYNIPGVIQLQGARYCAFENCAVQHIGWYGIELADGCTGNRVVGCEITDAGAGGIKLNGADAYQPMCRRTGANVITDNHIHHNGQVFHSGCGILARHTYGNEIAHNHIHHQYYSAISCGWVWGYTDSVAKDNHIEYNHIHDLGMGWLSDMGGIYLLGVAPGTVVRNNLIHDIRAHNYGGWCIYPDEGSSHLIIENNICYNGRSNCFNQHYGRENIVRNNIFAFGGDALANLGRAEAWSGFTMLQNIFITRDEPIYNGGYGCTYEPGHIRSDFNLFWSLTGAAPTFQRHQQLTVDLAAWRALGHDLCSVVADPQCADPERYDFTLAPTAPALRLGFAPIDMSTVGRRINRQEVSPDPDPDPG